MDRSDDGGADTPSWLQNLLIFELVTILVHQVLAASLFIRRRDKWPIRGRASWLVAINVVRGVHSRNCGWWDT